MRIADDIYYLYNFNFLMVFLKLVLIHLYIQNLEAYSIYQFPKGSFDSLVKFQYLLQQFQRI